MLSGRYRTDKLMRHWSSSNQTGLCSLPGCQAEVGDLRHILLECPALSEARSKAVEHWYAFLVPRPWLFPVVAQHTFGPQEDHLQFLLDPSVLPAVIESNQHRFYLARTWNYRIYLTRDKIRKQWNKLGLSCAKLRAHFNSI